MSLALNFERKCRTCGTDILELTCGIPIFGSGLQLDHKIHRYLGLDISLHDDLPKCLCATCFIKIESIDKFAILAKKTEEAYLGWFKCIRANIAKHYSPVPGSPVATTGATPLPIVPPGVIPQKIDFNALKLAVDDQIASSSQRVSPSSDVQVVKLIKPEIPINSYSDLKLGLLIKDLELLKLILKALKWADHDPRASFDVLIQRLKNTTFREVLSNHNLLNDSDLIQLLKSYIGQEAFLRFSGGSGAGGMNLGARAVTIKPAVLPVPVKSSTNSPTPSTTVIAKPGGPNDHRIEEDSVTQMEVGVDPSLFLDDEESQNKSKVEKPKKPENVVTIKLVPANLANKAPAEKLIPAILKCDVRSNGRHACTTCPESFSTNTDLQQHIVTTHLAKPLIPPPQVIPIDTKAIKIRVKKTKPQIPEEPPKTPPVQQIIPASIPISIPPTTTITVVPAVSKPVESTIQPVTSNTTTSPSTTTSALQKPTEPPKAQAKSKRKREIKRPLKIRLLPPKRSRTKPNPISSKLTCTICKKSFSSKSTLKDHAETHKSKEVPSPKFYTCEKCNQNFKSSSSLAKHKATHMGEKQQPSERSSRRGNVASGGSGSAMKTRTSRTTTAPAVAQIRTSVRAAAATGAKRAGRGRN